MKGGFTGGSKYWDQPFGWTEAGLAVLIVVTFPFSLIGFFVIDWFFFESKTAFRLCIASLISIVALYIGLIAFG